MPLIVEDGTMPDGANSYVSLEYADAYLVPRGLWPVNESKADNEPEDGNGDNEGNQEPDAPVEPDNPDDGENGSQEPDSGENIELGPEIDTQSEDGESGGETGDNGENPDPPDGNDTENPEPEKPDNPTEPEEPDTPDEPGPELPDTSKPDDDPEIAKKEAALMRAFDYLNGPLVWKGNKVDWQRMAAWPRENVPIPGTNEKKPEYIPDDVIPEAVCRAQMELAAFIYNGYDPLAPKERGGKYQQKSDSKTETVDVLSESESHSIAYYDNAPIDDFFPSVYPLLKPFLEEVPGEVQSGFTVHNILRG